MRGEKLYTKTARVFHEIAVCRKFIRGARMAGAAGSMLDRGVPRGARRAADRGLLAAAPRAWLGRMAWRRERAARFCSWEDGCSMTIAGGASVLSQAGRH